MDGVLVIDKSAGPTSFDVVKQVRAALKAKKAGHTGTLDPLATGVLPICLNEATKIAGFITAHDKAYDAVIRLGVETDTQDAQGKVTAQADPMPVISKELLESALAKFRGTFVQMPPMFSAVKVAGKRLYEHARAGEEIEREPRSVTVHELVLRDFSATDVTISVRCSKGFYVRTLAFDLGRVLGCGAHLKALRRTASGPFTLATAITLEKLGEAARVREQLVSLLETRLVSLADALSELPALTVSEADAKRVLHGLPIEVRAPAGRVRVLSSAHRLLAVAEVLSDRRLQYLRVLSS